MLSSPLDDPRLALALSLSREAGRHALAAAGSVQVGWKGPGERVTNVDTAVQSLIVRNVLDRFPADGVLAEEATTASSAAGEFVWVVDPLDGTNNYALGIPCFAVSLGVLHDGQPYAGVVHDPNTGFTCWALGGHGAFAGSRKLAVASRSFTPASNVSVRVPMEARLEPLIIDWLRRYKFRGFGSVALHLTYVALGAIDIVVDHTAALWDIAAAAMVVLEAGGRVTDLYGRPLFPRHLGSLGSAAVPFVAGNPGAHEATVSACRFLLDRPSTP